MRILHLISSSGFYGAEAVVSNLAASLARNGVDCAIGSIENRRHPARAFEERATALGLRVEVVPCGGRIDRGSIEWIGNFVKRDRIDVIHTHGYKADLHGYLAAR